MQYFSRENDGLWISILIQRDCSIVEKKTS